MSDTDHVKTEEKEVVVVAVRQDKLPPRPEVPTFDPFKGPYSSGPAEEDLAARMFSL